MDDARLMHLFTAIADHGGLSAVARAWGIAPSTVTHGLKQLENRLGVQLVLRTTRQFSLTPEGEQFLRRCRRVLADLDEAMTAFRQDGPLTGNIRITATNDFGRQRIAPLIEAFTKLHSGLHVQLFLTDAIVDLVEGGFDLGIRTGPLPNSDLKAQLLLRGRKCVCAAPEYWRSRGKPAHPRDLSKHNCLLFATPDQTQAFWSFREDGKAFRVRVSGDRTVNDGQALKHWAIAGAGVAMKSSFDVVDEVGDGRLETALDAFTSEATNLYAVFAPRSHEARRIRVFLDYLSERLAEEAPRPPSGPQTSPPSAAMGA